MSEQRLSGVVDWYAVDRGFGVINGEDNKDYFVHNTNLTGVHGLAEGACVTFLARPRHRRGGMEAYDVQVAPPPRPQPPAAATNFQPAEQPQTAGSPLRALSSALAFFRRKTAEPEVPPQPAHQGSTSGGYWLNRSRSAAAASGGGFKGQDSVEVKVAGVTYEGRQAIVALLSVGEQVWLRREPTNPYDSNAISVDRANGQQIGYVPRVTAAGISSLLDNSGQRVPATVVNIRGSTIGRSGRGVTIHFTIPGDRKLITLPPDNGSGWGEY